MNRDVEVRQCRVLVAVHDHGGVGAAARFLGAAQSTVSESLLALERVLGAPVIARRAGREALLTPLAVALLPQARALMAASDAIVAGSARQSRSTIRLGTVESVSSFLLPGPLGEFRTNCPQTDVLITIGLCEDLRSRVGKLELDAALTIEGKALASPIRVGTEFMQTRLRLVVAPGHALAGRIVTHRDLAAQTCLLTDSEGAFANRVIDWFGKAGRAPKLDSAGSIDGVKKGVLQGTAIGILADFTVARDLKSGALVALETRDPLPPISIRLTISDSPQRSREVENLLQLLRERLPDQLVAA